MTNPAASRPLDLTRGPLLLAVAALASGCFEVDGIPCPSGGEGCPTGYVCADGQCQPGGQDGTGVVVHVSLHPEVEARRGEIGELVFESFLGVGCLLGRDPDAASNLRMGEGELAPDVHASVSLEEATEVRVLAGTQALFVRARPAGGGGGPDVARACVTRSLAEGGRVDVWFTLLRANGSCGDGVVDPWEECDAGAAGSETCTTGCESIPVLVDSSGCHSSPAAACTGQRCLVGWVQDGWRVIVDGRHLDGSPDTGVTGGLTRDTEGASHLRVVADQGTAAALWLQGGGMAVATFDDVGQHEEDFTISGNSSGAVTAFAQILSIGGGETVPVGGWLSGSGSGVLARAGTDQRWEGDIGLTLSRGARGVIAGNRVFVTWPQEELTIIEDEVPRTLDSDGAAVGAWVSFSEEGAEASTPFLLAEDSTAAQSEPAVAAVSSEQVLTVWTDANGSYQDQDDTGIRARWIRPGGGGDSTAVNSSFPGAQRTGAVGAGPSYALATWVDATSGELRARYLTHSGAAVPMPFGGGQNAEFTVSPGPVVGPATIVGTTRRVYILWLEGGCGEGGGRRLMLLSLPAPYL